MGCEVRACMCEIVLETAFLPPFLLKMSGLEPHAHTDSHSQLLQHALVNWWWWWWGIWCGKEKFWAQTGYGCQLISKRVLDLHLHF